MRVLVIKKGLLIKLALYLHLQHIDSFIWDFSLFEKPAGQNRMAPLPHVSLFVYPDEDKLSLCNTELREKGLIKESGGNLTRCVRLCVLSCDIEQH